MDPIIDVASYDTLSGGEKEIFGKLLHLYLLKKVIDEIKGKRFKELMLPDASVTINGIRGIDREDLIGNVEASVNSPENKMEGYELSSFVPKSGFVKFIEQRLPGIANLFTNNNRLELLLSDSEFDPNLETLNLPQVENIYFQDRLENLLIDLLSQIIGKGFTEVNKAVSEEEREIGISFSTAVEDVLEKANLGWIEFDEFGSLVGIVDRANKF